MLVQRNDVNIQEYQHEKEMLELQLAHSEKIKAIDYEIAKLETKFNSWLKIPITIIKLPVYVVLGLGYVVSAFRKDNEPSDKFWEVMRK